MRATAFCLFVLVFCLEVSGQNWFNPGKTWYYDVTAGFDGSNYGIHRQTVEGDTLIMGKSCKILRYYPKSSPPFSDFLHQDGRKVYHYDDYRKEFELLYDFGLKAGDTLRHRSNFGIVTATDPVIIGDSTCASMVVQYSNQWVTYNMHYAEGIGIYPDTSSNLFYNCGPLVHTHYCSGAVDGWDYYVQCITDGDYAFPLPDCDEALNHTDDGREEPWSFYPNPSGPEITLKADASSSFRIISSTGITVRQGIKPGIVSLPALKSGIYLVCKENGCNAGDCRVLIIR